MKIKQKMISMLLLLFITLTMIPINSVQAFEELADINIVSTTAITVKEAEEWAKSKGATKTFISLASLYWKYSKSNGNVNPAIAYAQAAKETGYGKFGGVLDESYCNPCGLKTSVGGDDSDPNAHMRFSTWDQGVQAHLDHLALYAGASGYPRTNTYDPRHFATIKGKAVTVNSLGGKWAPSATYGEEINKIYNIMLSYVDEEAPEVKPEEKPEIEDTKMPTGAVAKEPLEIKEDNSTNISSKIGWKLENNIWYYYKSDGSKATGWIKPDANWYYLNKTGQMLKGWQYINGKWFYFKSSGIMTLGWEKINGKWYYLQGDGSLTTGYVKINDEYYYLNSSGEMLTSWVKIDNKWYYLNGSGIMCTGWIKLSTKWYYLFKNGVMTTGWTAINNKWYYMDENGAMKTGWIYLKNKWYYFNSDGSMETGWKYLGNQWYYLNDDGAMVIGWIKVNGEWYYFKSNGQMATGWLKYGSDYYYLNTSSGAMVKDTVIDGWKIGPDGIMGEKVNSSKLIVIDPGHNFGGDDGAYATHNGITYSERDLNMQIALKLRDKLMNEGFKVVLTRTENDKEYLNVYQSLSNRVNLANNLNANYFISLHHNAASIAGAYGVETYYSSNAQDSAFGGKTDAARIAKSKTMAVTINNKIVSKTGAFNRGAKDASLFVTRNTNMPSVLVELGFITNPSEAEKCAASYYQHLSAQAITESMVSIAGQ